MHPSIDIKTFLRVTTFPVLFGGAGLLGWWAFTPTAALWLMPLLVGGVGLLAFVLERVLPFQADWNQGPGAGSDLAYLGLTQVAVTVAEAGVWLLVAALVGALGTLALWPADWPVLAQIVLALAVGDLLPYLYHRASHETSGFLWRVHAIHHAPQRLHTLNFARFHPLNALLTAGLTLMPLALLGAPPELLFVTAVLHNVHGLLSHANIDVRLGPLNLLFSMAELHRWHHARDLTLANGNYGATLLVWDWLFGTRRAPGYQVGALDVGLAASSVGTVPDGLGAQLLAPFKQRQPARWWPKCCGAARA